MKPALIGLLPLFETTDHLFIWYSMEFYGNQWEKDPFPYTVIDNFLPEKLFKKINLEFEKKGILKDKKKKFETHVELNNKIAKNSDRLSMFEYDIVVLLDIWSLNC